jgi:hypothetical protein
MKTVSRCAALVGLGTFVLNAVARAHGLHPEVAPEYHMAVHIVILVGAAALAIGSGVWARRRIRQRRTDSDAGKPS